MNDNREIFEVPGVYENARRQTLTLALTVCAKCLKYMKLVQNKKNYGKISRLPRPTPAWPT
jgi:hypothetical protein